MPDARSAAKVGSRKLSPDMFPAAVRSHERCHIGNQASAKVSCVDADLAQRRLQVTKHSVEHSLDRQIPDAALGAADEGKTTATPIRTEAKYLSTFIRLESSRLERTLLLEPSAQLLRTVDEVAVPQIRQCQSPHSEKSSPKKACEHAGVTR